MLTSRHLDNKMLTMLRQGKSYFHIGCAGHEAAQVGAALALNPGVDWAYPYYRDQAFVLQWGVPMEAILQNFLARADDPSSGGRQLPQHYGYAELNMVSQSSSTGTQFLQAVGTAIACKKMKTKQVVYVSSGEGTTSQGDFYEAINWATRDKLPIIFFIEDNNYAISVPKSNQASGMSVYDMVMGYKNLHRHHINGLSVPETFKIVKHCTNLARRGKGPSVIVANTIRLLSHSSSDDQRKYRNKDELEKEKKLDPITQYADWLLESKGISAKELEDIGIEIRERVNLAADAAERAAMPKAELVEDHLYDKVVFNSPVSPGISSQSVVMVDAINHALHEEMEINQDIYIYGQDIADSKGGVFTVTRGLSSKFGVNRVFNSPLAESSIIGTAIGMAVAGLRPVVEIQFGDYIWTAMMQIRNELATMRWRSMGSYYCPIVIRVPVGGYIHGGLCHSQNIEGFFAHVPGIYICYPSNAADAKGLLKQAMRLNDPVLFLEHKGLYRQSYAKSPEPDKDYVLPFGHAEIKRKGKDLTIVTYGLLLHKSMSVAKELEAEGYDIEVIDLRTIVPLDIDTIRKSVAKTNRLLVVHEDTLSGGFGAEIVALVADIGFEFLDAPIKRIAAKDVPVPYNWDLEAAVLPSDEDVKRSAKELLLY